MIWAFLSMGVRREGAFQEVKACESASLLRTLFKVSFMGFGGHRSYLLRRKVPKNLSPFYFPQPQSGPLFPEMATITSHPVSTLLGSLLSD